MNLDNNQYMKQHKEEYDHHQDKGAQPKRQHCLHLTEGHANSNIYIDYIYGTVIKIFNYETQKLQKTFDGESKSINIFNKKLLERENNSGQVENRSNTLIIQDINRNLINLTYKYGRLTIDDIRAHDKALIGCQSMQD